MRFVGYVKSGGRDPQDRMMGVVIDDKVAPLASIDAFYEDLSGWRQRAAGLSEGEIPLADLTLAPPVPRDAKIVCAAINYVKHGAEAKLPTPTFQTCSRDGHPSLLSMEPTYRSRSPNRMVSTGKSNLLPSWALRPSMLMKKRLRKKYSDTPSPTMSAVARRSFSRRP